MNLRRIARWPFLALAGVVIALCVAYALWTPGADRTDGRHDRGRNGVWLGHGWIGADVWFTRNGRDPRRFRDPSAVVALAARLRAHGVTELYPHLCPMEGDSLPPHDEEQTERLLDATEGMRVMPWVGGVFERQVFPDEEVYRRHMARGVRELLDRHPGLAGVHLNVEPWPSGHAGMLRLLEAIRAALPPGRVLSVAAYPPPTAWQNSMEVHWTPAYFRAVAQRSDQVAVMMYDTGIRFAKPYEHLMARWTREVLRDAAPTPVLLGLPAYDDADKPWHRPDVESLRVALRGVHRGLGERAPANLQGVALYSEWEMTDDEWRWLDGHFLARRRGQGRQGGEGAR